VDRNLAIQAISDRSKVWDCLVIGGGATDLGTAVEDASRGLRTLLVEKKDFAKKTSSRATKLAHGGIRYLEQGKQGFNEPSCVKADLDRIAPPKG
jgi:glycerol-3-phosphate dehydrogenase